MATNTQTVTNENAQTATEKAWKRPRGISFISLPQRPENPYGVQWRVDGKRKTKSFSTPTDRLKFAKKLAGDVKAVGPDAYRLNPEEARAWRGFIASLGDGVSLDDVLRCWRKHGEERTKLPVDTAIASYVASKVAEGMSRGALSHYKAIFTKFSATYGVRDVSSITRDEIVSWVDCLEVDGQRAEPATRRTHQKRVREFFRWLRVGRLIAENPCDGIRPVKVVQKEVRLISPEDGAKLFEVNAQESVPDHRELCGRLALEAFAGIRFESVASIAAADIKWDMRGILLPATKIKTRKRQFIQNLPENLWAWLQWSKPETWTMNPRQYMQAKSLAFVRANVPHPRNCLRKCFATYHLAALGNAGHTAAILCHTSLTKLINDYNGIASAETGKQWFAVVPAG